MALQRASEYFGLTQDDFREAGVFDPVIGIDSLFFVDPLRLGLSRAPEFQNALQDVRAHYGRVIELLRLDNIRARDAARNLVRRKEIKGVGIGYGDKSDDGSAVGPELAERLLVSAEELIKMNITDPAIFEVMGLFEEDFGPDRLSDSIISILKDRIYTYTERISRELGLPTDYQVTGEEENIFLLPAHPAGTKPLLLLPKDMLRALPVASSFREVSSVAVFNDQVRARFNKILAPCFAKASTPKESIKEYLFANPERVSTLMAAYNSGRPNPYNFEDDPEGIISWFEKAQEIVAANPLKIPQDPTPEEVSKIVASIVNAFKNFIETKGGWRGLYDDKRKPLNERHARLLFYATALDYQGTSNLDISPESNAGQGPVDFKLSRGSKEKIIVEVKLSKGTVEHGYDKQTRIYQASEDAKESYFLILKVARPKKSKKKGSSKRETALERVMNRVRSDDEAGLPHPEVVVIDASIRASASRA